VGIYAISDLHLSFGGNKPMEIFGGNWENHAEKIEQYWREVVAENDLVLMPGDFSWAMYLKDTYKDFEYLNKLPGKKLLLKGNHDYWWTTLGAMRKYLKENNFENIDFIYNNSYLYEGKIIAGTRGWAVGEGFHTRPTRISEDNKMFKRENIRLELSIKDGLQKYGADKEIIVCMHFPPFNHIEQADMNFISTMKKYNVKMCIYGHIHGDFNSAVTGNMHGIDFKLVSSDYLDFKVIGI